MIKAIQILSAESRPWLYTEEVVKRLARDVEWVAPPQTAESIRENLTLLNNVEVIFAGWGTAIMDEEFLRHARILRAVFHAAGTVRYFTTPAFWARHITLVSGSAFNALSVAEYTLAVILFSVRDGWYYLRGAYDRGTFPHRRDMTGSYHSVVGLISLGAVGQLMCERLKQYEFRVIAYDPYCSEEAATRLGVTLVKTLEEIFAQADVISLHAPLLEETRGMIRREHFAAMKNRATFINTARGALVVEADLVDVLKERADLFAILDVTDPEPPVEGSPLYKQPNIILTPHIAGTCNRECERIGMGIVDEFDRWRAGQPLLHAITEEMASKMA